MGKETLILQERVRFRVNSFRKTEQEFGVRAQLKEAMMIRKAGKNVTRVRTELVVGEQPGKKTYCWNKRIPPVFW